MRVGQANDADSPRQSRACFIRQSRQSMLLTAKHNLLLFEHGSHSFIQVPGSCWAKAGGDGQQRIHLLILLQDLVILCTPLVIRLDPTSSRRSLYIAPEV